MIKREYFYRYTIKDYSDSDCGINFSDSGIVSNRSFPPKASVAFGKLLTCILAAHKDTDDADITHFSRI